MRRSLLFTIVLCTILLTTPALATQSTCQPGSVSEIVICHSGECVWHNDKCQRLRDGMTLRVPSGKTSIVVEDTNTAMYDYKVGSEALEVP